MGSAEVEDGRLTRTAQNTYFGSSSHESFFLFFMQRHRIKRGSYERYKELPSGLVFARLHRFPLLHYVSRFTAEHHGYFPLRVSLHPPDMGIGLASSLNCPLHGAYPSRAQHHSFRLSGFYKENLETLNGPASAFRLYRRPPSSFPSEMVALALKAQRHTQMVD